MLAVMLAVGLGQNLIADGVRGVLFCILRCLLLVLCLYPVFKIGGLGAGDVKLFGICAGFLSGNIILEFLFFSLLSAALISLFKILLEHNVKDRLFYLWEYILEVAGSGSWSLYFKNEREQRANSICLAGPVLCSILLHWGGVY